MIISILNPKGGSGKTTLAINLASALNLRQYNTILVDSDPQASARDWQAANADNPVPLIAMDRPGNFKSLPAIASDYQFTIIDGGSKLENLIAVGIKAADLILIPIQPSALDLWATSELIDLIQERQIITDGTPKAVFVMNRVIKATTMASQLSEALQACPFPVCPIPIHQRQVYAQATAAGVSIFQMHNNDAKFEISDIADFITQQSEFT